MLSCGETRAALFRLLRRSASLSEADWLLKKHSPTLGSSCGPPVARDSESPGPEGTESPGEGGAEAAKRRASSQSHSPLWRDGRWELSPLLEVAGVVSSRLDNCSTTSAAVINQDSCRHGAAVRRTDV